MLLDDIREVIGASWLTLQEVRDALPEESPVAVYALLIDEEFFERVNNHYRVL